MSVLKPFNTPAIDKLLEDPESQRIRLLAMSVYAKRTLLAFLQDFFLNPDNTDGRFIFTPDTAPVAQHQLRVASRFAFNQLKADSRPALVVARRSTSRERWTLKTGMKHQDIKTGTEERQAIHHFSFDLIAVSRVGDEAELLADITFGAVNAFNDELRSVLGWQSIGAVAMSGENPVQMDARPDMMTCVVNLTGEMRARYRRVTKASRLSYVVIEEEATSIDPAVVTVPPFPAP